MASDESENFRVRPGRSRSGEARINPHTQPFFKQVQIIGQNERWRMRADARLVPWPASHKRLNRLIFRHFVTRKNCEYQEGYQAKSAQFGFESGTAPTFLFAAYHLLSQSISAQLAGLSRPPNGPTKHSQQAYKLAGLITEGHRLKSYPRNHFCITHSLSRSNPPGWI